MKQALMTSPGVIEIRQVAKPVPGAGEALVRIERIGVCGSDVHVYHGKHPYTRYPVVQGHEVAGVIAQLGDGVTGLALDDRVVVMPQVTCGVCYPCRHGMYHICDNLKVMGFQTGGAAQEYFAAPAEMILKVGAGVSADEAVLIEPIAVAAHALGRAGSVAGQKVLVLGAGTIGNLVAQVARASGAASVMITDISEYKLAKARGCGIEHVVNTETSDLNEAILEAFGPDKADVILECVGVQATMSQAIANARKGSTIVVVGVFGQRPEVDMGLVQDRELSLVGTLMYQKKDYERAIELVAGGRLSLGDMVSHKFQFDEYAQAYKMIEASGGNYLKVMIVP
jgi:L-iditol 2-dehydrogenase